MTTADTRTAEDPSADDRVDGTRPADPAPPADAIPPVAHPARPWWRRHVFELVVALAFVGAVLTGTTTSSLAVPQLRITADTPVTGLLAGTPRTIRIDEWSTNTPVQLGVIASHRGDPVTPLAQSTAFVSTVPRGGIAESIVFFDGSLLFAPLPDQMVFAAVWWLPVLLLGLFMPTWLQRLGVVRPLAVLATWLTLLAPATAWWSWIPVHIVAYTVVGAVAAMAAADRLGREAGGVRRWLVAGLLLVVAGILFARMPAYYAPWSLTISVGVVLVTLAHLLARPGARRAAFVVLAGTVVTTAVFLGGVLLENADALRSLAATVYPGNRHSTGNALPVHEILAAPALAKLQDAVPLTGTNASELSSAYTVAAVWALVLGAVGLGRRAADPEVVRSPLPLRVAIAVTGAVVVFWLSWCTVAWGSVGAAVPLLNRVPPERAAQTVGYLAVVLVVLVLSRPTYRPTWRTAVLAAAVCGGVTAYAASDLREVTPTGLGSVAAAALGTALAVGLVTRFPRRWWSGAVVVVLAAAVVVTANPVQVGLGSFRDNPAADALLTAGDQARAGHYLWVSNSNAVDALLTATGVPSLGGRQLTGPVHAEWSKLDPSGRFEDNWNRGGSYIEFRWSPGATLAMTNPNPDEIVVTLDPCSLPATGLPVRRLVSDVALSGSCLTPVSTFEFGGETQRVYAVAG